MINAGETIIKIKANGDCSLKSKGMRTELIVGVLQQLLTQVVMHAGKVCEDEAREAIGRAFLMTANSQEDAED